MPLYTLLRRMRTMFPFLRQQSRLPDPAARAQSLLNTAWGDEGYPVDPFHLAKRLGLRVLEGPLPADVSGKLFKQSGQAPVILLNETDPRNRQRFTCAHELGHYHLRLSKQPATPSDDEQAYVDTDTYEYTDYRDGRSVSGQDADERFANQFAAALLMPPAAVKQMVQQAGGADILVLAEFFGVSAEAMRFRLKNLGYSR